MKWICFRWYNCYKIRKMFFDGTNRFYGWTRRWSSNFRSSCSWNCIFDNLFDTHSTKNWIVLYLLYYISIVIGEYPTHAVKYPLNLQGNKIAQTIRVYPGYIGKNNQLNLKKGMRCTGNNRYNKETNQIFLRKIQSSFADDTKRTYH